MKSIRTRAFGAHRGGLSGLLAFALIVTTPAFAADPLVTNNPLQDLWVAAPNLKGTTGNLLLGGSAGKEIFLRFHVDESAGTGTPMTAQLKLYQTAGAGGGDTGTIQVYAANNRSSGATADWTETSLTWGNKPVHADQLDTTLSRTTAGDVVFDLPDYISGPGDYSFRIVITGSAVEHSFGHKGSAASQRPRLEFRVEGDNAPGESFLDPNSPYYKHLPSDNLDLGGIYATRYQLSNPGSAAINDIDNIGYINVTKQPYGAKPNDASYDSTWAIQRAVNEARDARLAVYFPPGTYYVTRTIHMTQGDNPHETINDPHGALRWNSRLFPCVLLGDRAGARPTIKIMGSSTYFDNSLNHQPVLHFWSRFGTADDTADPEVNRAAFHYNQWLDNIDLDLSGKAGAVGIDMDGAQGTNLTNSKITATSAYAGILGGTGPGAYTYGVEIVGGQFGGYFEAAHCPLIVNSKFKDQTSHALYHAGRGPLTLVGVQIESAVTQTGARVKLNATNSNPWQAALNVVDSSIQGTGLLIDTNRSVSLTNAYLKNGSGTAIKQTDPEDGAVNSFALGAASWRIVSEYARGVLIDQQKYPAPTPDDTLRVQYWINGTASTSGNAHYVDGGTASTPPAYMIFGNAAHRHQLPDSPNFTASPDNGFVINAKTSTVGGPAGVITAAKLNALIGSAGTKAIFIPVGEYLLNNTVTFASDTRFFGVSPAFSTLRIDPNLAAPMIESSNSAAATSMLADLKLLLPLNSQSTASMVSWQAGANSVVKNVGFDDRWTSTPTQIDRTVPLIKISGSGGGKWAGVWIGEGKNARPPTGWMIEVNGTSQALKFYMLNLEHNATSPQGKFINANNFDIYQVKAESQGTSTTNPENELFWFEGCQYFRAFGFGGSARPDTPDPDVGPTGHTLIRLHPFGSKNSNHYMITQLQFQQPTNGGTGSEPDPNVYSRLMEKMTSDLDYVVRVRGDRQAVLVKRGTPPNN